MAGRRTEGIDAQAKRGHGSASARAKASLRAGAVATRGFRPPRGSASCSNTRARYIHVPLGRNPLAATSSRCDVSRFDGEQLADLLHQPFPSKRVGQHRRSHGHPVGERRGGAGIGRKQAMDGLRSPVGAMDGATRRCARSPHHRGSPRSQCTPALFAWAGDPTSLNSEKNYMLARVWRSTQTLRMLRQRPGHVLAHQWRRMVASGFQRGEYLGR